MSEMNGVFAVCKPSGITSAQFLSKIQYLFTNSNIFKSELSRLQGEKVQQIQREGGTASRRKLRKVLKVKMGHGGTLDPLASGVMVVGVGLGTKRLQNYLNGSIKVYETEALLGGNTTTGDVEGELISKNGVAHITKDDINGIPEKFLGHLRQTPPIYAALKMNGKPLYEYAREGIPLPKEIKSREVQVYEMEIFDDSLSTEHEYKMLDFQSTEVEHSNTLIDNKLYYSKEYAQKNNTTEEQEVALQPHVDGQATPLLHFKVKVSSGTYIRSLISDVGKSLGSCAYMTKLIREEQAEWKLGKNVITWEDFERKEQVWGDVLKLVLEKGGDVDINVLFKEAEKKYEGVEDSKPVKAGRDEKKDGKEIKGTTVEKLEQKADEIVESKVENKVGNETEIRKENIESNEDTHVDKKRKL